VTKCASYTVVGEDDFHKVRVSVALIYGHLPNIRNCLPSIRQPIGSERYACKHRIGYSLPSGIV
jgi:hypothetical protein